MTASWAGPGDVPGGAWQSTSLPPCHLTAARRPLPLQGPAAVCGASGQHRSGRDRCGAHRHPHAGLHRLPGGPAQRGTATLYGHPPPGRVLGRPRGRRGPRGPHSGAGAVCGAAGGRRRRDPADGLPQWTEYSRQVPARVPAQVAASASRPVLARATLPPCKQAVLRACAQPLPTPPDLFTFRVWAVKLVGCVITRVCSMCLGVEGERRADWGRGMARQC